MLICSLTSHPWGICWPQIVEVLAVVPLDWGVVRATLALPTGSLLRPVLRSQTDRETSAPVHPDGTLSVGPTSLTPTADLPDDYGAVLAAVKQNIKDAQLQAHRVVNKELIKLYWTIGKTILDRQGQEGWGAKVIDRLSADLRHEFPDTKGTPGATWSTSTPGRRLARSNSPTSCGGIALGAYQGPVGRGR